MPSSTLRAAALLRVGRLPTPAVSPKSPFPASGNAKPPRGAQPCIPQSFQAAGTLRKGNPILRRPAGTQGGSGRRADRDQQLARGPLGRGAPSGFPLHCYSENQGGGPSPCAVRLQDPWGPEPPGAPLRPNSLGPRPPGRS